MSSCSRWGRLSSVSTFEASGVPNTNHLRVCTRDQGYGSGAKGPASAVGGAMPRPGGGRRRVVGCGLGVGAYRYICEHVNWPCLLASQQHLHPSPAWLRFEHRVQAHELRIDDISSAFYIQLLPLLHASRGSRPCDTAESRGTCLCLEPTTRAPPAPWMRRERAGMGTTSAYRRRANNVTL